MADENGTPGEQGPGGGEPGGPGTDRAPAAPPAIPVDVLPESLRGKPESEIKFILGNMTKAVEEGARQRRDLENQLREARTTPRAPDPPKDTTPKKPLADRLLEDPENALKEFLAQEASPFTQQLNQINERLGDTELNIVKSSVADFSEYEEEVIRLLDESKAPRTRANLMGAYTMAVGMRAIETQERNRRAATKPEKPAAEVEKTKKKYSKSPLSEEIRVSLGMSEEDYYEKYSNSENLEIKVPS